MFNIDKLNSISSNVNDILTDGYNVGVEISDPDAILVRSFDMHSYETGKNLLAVARAGAGVNNIPIKEYAEKGICVFNTPGANANAVKELVLCAMIMSSRNVISATEWVLGLKGKGAEVAKLVESGKKNFVGHEISGKKLGIIGLGYIGTCVANAAVSLGMDVYGYDPFITIDNAWALSRKVKRENDINHLLSVCDYITIHVPYNDSTKGLINAKTITNMKDGAIVINCARGELVVNEDIIKALESGKIAKYITDFPNDSVIGVKNVIAIPHLGASTPEAEDNCASMAAKQLKDYLENGNIVNSVNMPAITMPKSGVNRLCIIHNLDASMVANVSLLLHNDNVPIGNMSSVSRGNIAYTIIDTQEKIPENVYTKIVAIKGIIKLRLL